MRKSDFDHRDVIFHIGNTRKNRNLTSVLLFLVTHSGQNPFFFGCFRRKKSYAYQEYLTLFAENTSLERKTLFWEDAKRTIRIG